LEFSLFTHELKKLDVSRIPKGAASTNPRTASSLNSCRRIFPTVLVPLGDEIGTRNMEIGFKMWEAGKANGIERTLRWVFQTN
jgi:hypothetical protein